MDASSSATAQALLEEFQPAHLVRDRPARRDLTCVNVERGPKELHDRLQDVFSARLGRRLTQWETFALVVSEVAERYEAELATLRGR